MKKSPFCNPLKLTPESLVKNNHNLSLYYRYFLRFQVNSNLGNLSDEPGMYVFTPTMSPKSPFALIENISSFLVLSVSMITGGELPTS